MRAEDVALAILYLNEKRGRRLNERGVKRIAETVNVDVDEALGKLKELGLVDESLVLTEKGREEAQRALKRLEAEVKRGLLGFIKWVNFKARLAPEKLTKGSCVGALES